MADAMPLADVQERLYEAIEASDAAAVRVALKAGADVNEVRLDRGDRQAPLLHAFQYRNQDTRNAVTRALLQAGANPNLDAFVSDCIEEDRLPLAKLLLKHGGDPNGATDFGERREPGEPYETLLIDAVQQRKPTFVKALLEAGADPNLHGENDESPLLLAKINKDKRCVKLLEADVSDQERSWVEERRGPVYQAMLELDRKILESIGAADVDRTVDLLKSSGRQLDTPLLPDALLPLEEAFSVFFRHRIPPMKRGKNEPDPVGDRYLAQIEAIFELGAPADVGVYFPPIIEASHLPDERQELYERMLASIPDPNVTSTGNETALFSTISLYSAGRCRLLLERGVDPNIRNENGETVLHFARSLEKFHGPNPCIPLLLKAGAVE